ncbi:arylsulfatase [Rhodopirellula sallentina]|uniref:Sulfatase family protein n=1 Tax=Rhodopirellula sallentina SM41 TaxID=1263870 RepID=M5UB75_9BACT|nr:arylsulfatase [Rhodopirellula sallentina]EMI53233.1 sulfatase family protein [Rhodopirellula sallentina SM41]
MFSRPFIAAAWLPLLLSIAATTASAQSNDGSVLPFPPVPSASHAGETILESEMQWREQPQRLPDDAPNILIVLIDDVGFGQTDTFGGEIHTPTLSRLAQEGVSYNRFHTTSICSPTRAALLTGRNHHRVGNGTIAERASDFDGYTGVIPKSSATLPEVLHYYGYKSAAFGKWHNTPANQTTAMGPFDRWPTGHGFDYFYGFLAGETSQYEPRLYENLDPIEPPQEEGYHLTEDMVDKAMAWLKRHQAFSPDKPFLMYWAPGAVHGPHHVFSEWADKYQGKFDDGWDAYRERVFKRQKQLGWIPANTKLTPRPDTLAAWDRIPESQRAFQRRLMEVFAGFAEHTDAQVGKLVDGLEQLGVRENTLIFYIWGDNGASAEGQQGSISEVLAQNNIPNTVEQQIVALDQLGGLAALGTSKTDNMYHAGWAWAGATPLQSTKLVAAHFGGTRNPMVVSWPKGIQPDDSPRSQFHHVNDIVPTVYDIVGVPEPKTVNGYEQDPIDGVSMAYSFADANAKGRKKTQYFENNASRGVYHDGWFACTFGPFLPWDTPSTAERLQAWNPSEEKWELYNLENDFSQANDLAGSEPGQLAEMKQLFLDEAKENKVLPIGGGLWTRFHPEDVISSPYTSWRFDATTQRMPEFTAPGLGKKSNVVTIELDAGANASGVLYALGGSSGGLTLYMDEGKLVYEYNMLLLERYRAETSEPLSPGEHTIEVDTTLAKPGAPATVILKVDGEELARTIVERTVPLAFTASETFDVGVDLGAPVSLDYAERRPFEFDGTIKQVTVVLK